MRIFDDVFGQSSNATATPTTGGAASGTAGGRLDCLAEAEPAIVAASASTQPPEAEVEGLTCLDPDLDLDPDQADEAQAQAGGVRTNVQQAAPGTSTSSPSPWPLPPLSASSSEPSTPAAAFHMQQQGGGGGRGDAWAAMFTGPTPAPSTMFTGLTPPTPASAADAPGSLPAVVSSGSKGKTSSSIGSRPRPPKRLSLGSTITSAHATTPSLNYVALSHTPNSRMTSGSCSGSDAPGTGVTSTTSAPGRAASSSGPTRERALSFSHMVEPRDSGWAAAGAGSEPSSCSKGSEPHTTVRVCGLWGRLCRGCTFMSG